MLTKLIRLAIGNGVLVGISIRIQKGISQKMCIRDRLIIGAGPTGICTLLCVMLRKPQRIVVCEQSSERIRFVREHYPQVEVVTPEGCKEFVLQSSPHGGTDVVFEVAGGEDTFRLAWE